jgi:hypothetical protein
MNCPHCNHELSEAEIRSIWGAYCASLATPHAGPGRPRYKKHCRCGAMTLERAAKRNHKCPPKARRAA